MAKPITNSGGLPLRYMGVEPITPYEFVIYPKDPISDDYDFDIGTVWLKFDKDNPDNEKIWMLVKKEARVATWLLLTPSVTPGILFLTGNTGGEVGVDMGHNVDTVSGFSPLTLDGNAGTFTITLNSDGSLATSYDTDAGSAVPIAGVLNMLGGTGGLTSGSGNTITVSGDLSVAIQYDADIGSATPASNILNIVGGGSISTSAAGNTVTIDDSAYDPIEYVTDAGSAIPSGNILNMFGGDNVTTSGSGDTVTVSLNNIGGPGVVVTNILGILSSSNGLDGQVLISATGAAPEWEYVTSTGNTVELTFGPNTIDISASGAGLVAAGENINLDHPAVINLNETIHWPNTNMAGTTGALYLGGSGGTGGSLFMHNYGSTTTGLTSVYLGISTGNLTLNTSQAVANIALGSENMPSVTTGGYNTSIGSQCCFELTTGSQNVGIGEQCLRDITTGSGNTCVGNGSLPILTSGNYYTVFGSLSAQQITVGEDAVIMGCLNAGSSEGSPPIDLNMCLITMRDTEAARSSITLGGFANAVTNTTYIYGIYGYAAIGGVQVKIAGSVLGTNTSSIHYKENIKPIEKNIDALEAVAFTYKGDETKRTEFGLIAEEMAKHFPEMVVYDKYGEPFTIQYDKLTALLLKEIQSINEEITTLECA